MREVAAETLAVVGRDLKEIHKDLNVTDYHFDCFCSDFQKAMMGLGMDENLIDEVLITMEPLRQTVLGRDGSEHTRSVRWALRVFGR